MDFFPELFIDEAQAEVIARGLFAVARAEGGVHEREAAMVKSFFGEAVSSGLSMAHLEQSPDLEPATLATALGTPELAQLFLKSAILLGYADGTYGAKERQVVGDYAKALGVGETDLGELEASVKDYLLSHLTQLQNVEAAVSVAKELGR